MCNAQAAVAAGQATIGQVQNFQQFQLAEKQARKDAKAAHSQTLADQMLQSDSVRSAQQESRVATSSEIQSIISQSIRAISSSQTSAAESGVTGRAAAAVARDFERQSLNFQTATETNQEFQEAQFERQARGLELQTTGRLIAGTPRPISRPTFLGAALAIGLDSGTAYLNAQ